MNLKLDQFREYLMDLDISHTTKVNYFLQVRQITSNCSTINYDTVNKYIRHWNEVATRNKAISAFKKYGHWRGWKWVDKFKRKREPDIPPAVFLDDEIKKITARYKYGSRDWMFLRMFSFTTARPISILKLETSDIDLASKTILFRNTKNGEHHLIPIPDEIHQDVVEYLSTLKTNLLFPNSKEIAKPITEGWCAQLFKKKAAEIGLTRKVLKNRRLRFYSLKHSCCTRLSQGGLDIWELKELTGHKKLESLIKYLQMTIEEKRKNFNKDRMARASLPARVKYEQLVELLEELSKDYYKETDFETVLNKKNNEIVFKVKLKRNEPETSV